MCCVACLIFPHDVAVIFAKALLFISKIKNMRETYKDVCVCVCACNEACLFFRLWILYVLCSMHDISICVHCTICDSSPSHS